MKHTCEFEFKKSTINKKSAEGRNVYSAIASTATVDRHKEVLIPKGCIATRFLTNPVMLNIHNGREYPVGKVLDVKIDKSSVQFDFEFADTENGKELEKLYVSGFMNAFSVGFIPKQYVDCYDLRDNEGNWKVSSIEFDLPDGTKESFDLSAYKTNELYGIVPKWELLEISPVSIPANPDALLLRAKDDAVRKFIDQGHSKAAVSLVERRLTDNLADLSSKLHGFMAKLESEAPISSVVPYTKSDVVDEAWDVQDSRAALVVWSSSDKSGDKETMDWGQYAKGFGWVDVEKADKFSSYHFCHHTVKEGNLLVVWKGLCLAMATLLTELSSNTDAKEVYDHLNQHYADFGKTAPEYKEYSIEDIEKIKSGEDLIVKSDEAEAPAEELSTNSLEVVTTGLTEIKASVKELEEVVRLRFNILGRVFDELQKTVESSLTKQSDTNSEASKDDSESNTDESKLLAEKLSALHLLFSDINQSNA